MWISILMVAAIGGCPKISVLYHEDEGFTSIDYGNMRHAELRCKKITGSICLKRFKKIHKGNYHAVCTTLPSKVLINDPNHPQFDKLCLKCHKS